MPVRVIPQDAALLTVLEEAVYTFVRVQANPLTASFAPDFDAFITELLAVHATEIQLWMGKLKASAVADHADDDLDDFSSALAKILRTIVAKTDPLFTFYYPKPPSELNKPRLGPQLAAMTQWVKPLQDAPQQVLKDNGAALVAKVKAGTDAEAGIDDAEAANKQFRTIGKRRTLIDDFNALRKSTEGNIAKLPFAPSGAQLPSDFSSRFFKHEKSKPAEKPPTSDELKKMIEAKQAEILALDAQLKTTLADEEKAAAAELKKEADAKALADAKKAEEDAKAKVKELEKKLKDES